MGVYMMARDDGGNDLGQGFRPPPNVPFENPLPGGKLWRLLRLDVIELASDRLFRAVRECWQGSAVRLVPIQPRRRRY